MIPHAAHCGLSWPDVLELETKPNKYEKKKIHVDHHYFRFREPWFFSFALLTMSIVIEKKKMVSAYWTFRHLQRSMRGWIRVIFYFVDFAY
jgi:hypothetical protein